MKKKNAYFILSLITAIWFALTSAICVYYFNLIVSFPFGILSLILWKKGRKIDDSQNRYKAIPIILSIGAAISVIMLVVLLFINY
jgi:ABC-type methionine transport system permease subunit